MYGREIQNLLLNNPRTKPYFRGVYSADTIVRCLGTIDLNAAFNLIVLNTAPSDRSGHWITICIFGKQENSNVPPFTGWWLDSLANEITDSNVFSSQYKRKEDKDQQILHLLNHPSITHWSFLPFPIQSLHSKLCGSFAVYFCFAIVRGLSIQSILKPFSNTQLLSNDKRLLRILYNYG